MAPSTTRSQRCTPGSSDGLTVIELLVALLIATIVLGAALALTLSSSGLFQTDRARTDTNQSLRGILDIVGNDIRTAGERLNTFTASGKSSHALAAVEIEGGHDLYLRRNLLNDVLPLCGTLDSSVTTVPITSTDSSVYSAQPLCDPDDPAVDSDGDGVPDALVAWQDYREQNGPAVGAFVYSSADGGKSDLFLYVGESDNEAIVRAGGNLVNDYVVENQAVILLIEERHYYLNDDVLELVINGDTANPLRLVNNISDFSVRAITTDGAVHEDLAASGSVWSDLRGVEVSITGLVQEGRRQVERTLSSRYFPRNVLSD